MDEALLASMLASTLRVSTPLILCALAGFIGSAVAPKALGKPYSKER